MSTIDTQSHVARIDVLKDLSKMTLDVIGLAGMIHSSSPECSMADSYPGFNYNFDSLNTEGKPNELGQAFQEAFNVPDKIPILLILRTFFPIFRLIVSASRSGPFVI